MSSLSNQCIHQIFEEQVFKTPGKIALIMEDRKFNYLTLNEKANQLANALRSLGIKLETPVGICLRRSPEAVVAILGVLKAGGAYVPIDPDFPEARKNYIIEDSGCGILITENSLLDSLLPFKGKILQVDDEFISKQASSNLDTAVDPDALMYILYTSGSTGIPKGVCGVHRATVNRCLWMWTQYPFSSDEVCCNKTTLNFVDSVWEIFGALLKGIPLVILPQSRYASPEDMIKFLRDAKVTRIILVPSLLKALLNTHSYLGRILPDLKIWTVSGEELARNLLQQFRENVSHGILLNLYGSTEVAGDVTWAEFTGNGENVELDVPIGQPIFNAEIYVLDENLQCVAPGNIGELWVGGNVLARGYHNKPEETKARFMINPFSGNGILFKTGDLVRRCPNGILYYIGRLDNQIKIRGFRVELGEIEKTLAQFCPEISNIAVILQEDKGVSETKQLVAFVVPSTVNIDALKQFALSHLPHYMVPARIVAVDALPLTPNGKLDRQALSGMSGWRMRTIDSEKLPQTETEKLLAVIWQKMFLVSSVSRDDDFFYLGGDSLSVVSFLGKLKQEFGVSISLSNFIHEPSLASLSRLFDDYKQKKHFPVASASSSEFVVVPFGEQYLEQTVVLVSECFALREPLGMGLGLHKEEFNTFAEKACRACLSESLSFVALHRLSGKVVGFCLGEDFSIALSGELAIPGFLNPIFALLDSLDQMYVKKHGEVKKGEIAHVFMSGAASHMDGTEIILVLENHVLEAAINGNYKRVVTTCTHSVSIYIAQELAYQRMHSVQYASFEFEGKKIFANVPAHHQEAVLFEKVLEKPSFHRSIDL
jgi:amino acid adenylation domain-containing protein